MQAKNLEFLRKAVQAAFLVSPSVLNYTPPPSSVASGEHRSQPEDPLDMFIMGHLIPAGTGFPEHRQLKLVEKGEPVGAPVMEDAEPQPAIG